jgi:MvaI/BcnI restriction endonuclease family
VGKAATTKLESVIFVCGKTRKVNDERYVQYGSAHILSDLRRAHFLDLIAAYKIVIDFDVREQTGLPLRDHGTKFRLNPRHVDINDIWQKIQLI